MEAESLPAEIKAVNKIAEKSSHSVSYSADTIASWGAKDSLSKGKNRPSATGSLYYTASESEGRSEIGSVYDAISLPDSDDDFQVEVESASKIMALGLACRVLSACICSCCVSGVRFCWSQQSRHIVCVLVCYISMLLACSAYSQ